MDMFAYATREKFRFETTKGPVGVEDLWDLPLQSTVGRPNLNTIAKELHNQLKDDEFSLIDRPAPSQTTQMKLDIVKFVFETRQEEVKAANTKQANAEKKQKLLAILADRENEAYKTMDVEDIKKLINEMA